MFSEKLDKTSPTQNTFYCRTLLTSYGHIKQYELNIHNDRIAKLAFHISYIHKIIYFNIILPNILSFPMQALYYKLPYKNSTCILHFPIHATCPSISYSMTCPYQYTAKRGYNDGSLHYATVYHPSATSCTCRRHAFPHYSTLKHPESYSNYKELRILCVSPARSV